MRAAAFTAIVASLVSAVAAQSGFNCKPEGFCPYSDPNCNFCLDIDPAAQLKICQAIDPTYKSSPGKIERGPSGADFQCQLTCCH